MYLKNVKLQFLLVAGVSALLGYAAAYGKLNPFQQADAGPTEQPKAATVAAPAAPGCCSDGLSKAGMLALATHNEAVADKAAAAGKKPNHALHRLLRRGQLHGGAGELHHRRNPDPHRPDDRRPGGLPYRHAR
jgi:hypothetical protein